MAAAVVVTAALVEAAAEPADEEEVCCSVGGAVTTPGTEEVTLAVATLLLREADPDPAGAAETEGITGAAAGLKGAAVGTGAVPALAAAWCTAAEVADGLW